MWTCTHHVEEGVLQGAVLGRRLVEQVLGEVHVGDAQAEEHHQLPAVSGRGHGGRGQVSERRRSRGVLLPRGQEATPLLWRLVDLCPGRRRRPVQLHGEVFHSGVFHGGGWRMRSTLVLRHLF